MPCLFAPIMIPLRIIRAPPTSIPPERAASIPGT